MNHSDGDLNILRQLSTLPGGFSEPRSLHHRLDDLVRKNHLLVPSSQLVHILDPSRSHRKLIWSFVLGTSVELPESKPEIDGLEQTTQEHRDERQVELDINRSFVYYPTHISDETKIQLRKVLTQVIVKILRRFPKLNYFQGYHDVVSVFILNFLDSSLQPPENPLPLFLPNEDHRDRQQKHEDSEEVEETDEKQVGFDDKDEKQEYVEKEQHEQEQQQQEKSSEEALEVKEEKEKHQEEENHTDDSRRNNKIIDEDCNNLINCDRQEQQNRPLIFNEDDVDLLEKTVQKFTLHRIRDSMTDDLSPIMGYLRFTQAILKQVNPRFASLISHTSNLPLFTLSWILTLTSHDLKSLDTVSRIFDFLLCYPPIMICYLASAICLEKSKEIEQLMIESENNGVEVDLDMVHFIMSTLPRFRSGSKTEVKPAQIKHIDDQVNGISNNQSKKTSAFNHSEGASESKTAQDPVPDDTLLDNQDQSGISIEEIIQSTVALYERYEPSNPRLKLHAIMGPKSCINTWSESERGALSDQEAESILNLPIVQIVKPDPHRPRHLKSKSILKRLFYSTHKFKFLQNIFSRLKPFRAQLQSNKTSHHPSTINRAKHFAKAHLLHHKFKIILFTTSAIVCLIALKTNSFQLERFAPWSLHLNLFSNLHLYTRQKLENLLSSKSIQS